MTGDSKNTSTNYSELGVSAGKEGLHRVLTQAGLAQSPELFAQISDDFAGDPEFASILHCDGAGTKTLVSYLSFKDTGDCRIFATLADDALVMNLDDVYCIGRPSFLLLGNAIARNARLINDDCVGAIIARYKHLCELLRHHGVPLHIGGGETADCGDVVRTLVVDATLCGRIDRKELIFLDKIRVNDVIIGLSSAGQARYEETVNSGIGSNGLTLARHSLLHKDYASAFPECVDPNIDQEIIYRGPFKTTDCPSGLKMSIGEALSSPTRTYAPVLHELYSHLPGAVHGAIHLTGGAHTKVLRFGQGKTFYKDNLFEPPEIFRLIQKHGCVSNEEMYRVFNMGTRLELYVDQSDADEVISLAESFGIEARIVGRVLAHPQGEMAKNQVVLKTKDGDLAYSG